MSEEYIWVKLPHEDCIRKIKAIDLQVIENYWLSILLTERDLAHRKLAYDILNNLGV